MKDPREKALSDLLVNYSIDVQENENVLIEAFNIPDTFVVQLIGAIRKRKGNPFVTLKSSVITRELLCKGNENQLGLSGKLEAAVMKEMDCYIGVRGSLNIAELSDVPPEDMKRYELLWNYPVHKEIRVPKTRWVVLRYPTPSMAQQAGMSTEAFEDFFFNVCTLDYSKMSHAMDPLVAWINKTDKVRITGRDTELTFSIKGFPGIKCDGKANIPDGEVFTAPVKESVNGVIHYNTPTLYQGTIFQDIRLTFKDGKIVDIEGDHPEKLRAIFDTDDGARYVGEFAIGLNPWITEAMLDILFDEKIAGSIHFTPGDTYEETNNGNKSAIHWDLVLRQTPEYGGGEIWFDDTLIRKDGRFILPELEGLNPENLK
ncbi:MAG: aminopeptidase [Candidatus Marinimicrobia bacterium]|nr:aminopeptidase [Candidatus Neomarinimicrobiota bacterium]